MRTTRRQTMLGGRRYHKQIPGRGIPGRFTRSLEILVRSFTHSVVKESIVSCCSCMNATRRTKTSNEALCSCES